MAHFLLHVASTPTASPDDFRGARQAYESWKQIAFDQVVSHGPISLALKNSQRGSNLATWGSVSTGLFVAALGTWLPVPARPDYSVQWLAEQYVKFGADGVARAVQGFFVIVILDFKANAAHVITDRCGSYHAFHSQDDRGIFISSSSAALAAAHSALPTARLDPIGLHQFIATGIIFGNKTLWKDVIKVPGASIVDISPGQCQFRKYWDFDNIPAERLDLPEAVSKTREAMLSVLRALPIGNAPYVSDLTGGYDSRFLLCGLLDSGKPFQTTVSGPLSHPDVVVAKKIATAFNFDLSVINPPVAINSPMLEAALRRSDGECDVFEYGRIQHVHEQLSDNFSMSLNGSFGELARGYWWELLWPNLGANQALDTNLLATRRFAAIPYKQSLFTSDAKFNLADFLGSLGSQTISSARALPNTSQMDCLYYGMRMQRWQGRIASSTNQIWPAISPIGFSEILDPILSAKAATRFNSGLVKKILSKTNKPLASIPLEHGYPAMPMTPLNFWRFSPLVAQYGHAIARKLKSKLFAAQTQITADRVANPEYAAALESSEIGSWNTNPILLETGLFDPPALIAAMQSAGAPGSIDDRMWRRLITVEWLLRTLPKIQASDTTRQLSV